MVSSVNRMSLAHSSHLPLLQLVLLRNRFRLEAPRQLLRSQLSRPKYPLHFFPALASSLLEQGCTALMRL